MVDNYLHKDKFQIEKSCNLHTNFDSRMANRENHSGEPSFAFCLEKWER